MMAGDGAGNLVRRLCDDGRIVIFLFHGVIERQVHKVRNYTRKHLPVAEFAEIMEELARAGCPLSMDDVLAHCERGEAFPRNAFSVTFDDGFENNLSVARPVLDRVGIPGTVYVTTRFIDENGMSWIDRIEHAFENAADGSITLPWLSEPKSFAHVSERIAILKEIRQHVKSNPHLDVDQFVSDVHRQLNLEEVDGTRDPLDLKMTWEQVAGWGGGGHIIGGHSHTHPILSFLTEERLEAELDTSLRLLREKAGLHCRHYSYPEGLAHCYSDAVIDALKMRGIACCPTAIDGVNSATVDPFHLRRVMVS